VELNYAIALFIPAKGLGVSNLARIGASSRSKSLLLMNSALGTAPSPWKGHDDLASILDEAHDKPACEGAGIYEKMILEMKTG